MKIIGGLLKGHPLTVLGGEETRPTSAKARDALMQVLNTVVPESSFVDLFAGSGAVGMEALSRGASEVIFYELDKGASKAIKQNMDMAIRSFAKQGLPKPSCILRPVDAFKSFEGWSKYEVVFADPPYESSELFTSQLMKNLRLKPAQMQTIVCEYDQRDHDKIENSLRLCPDGWNLKFRSYGRNSFYFLQREDQQ